MKKMKINEEFHNFCMKMYKKLTAKKGKLMGKNL